MTLLLWLLLLKFSQSPWAKWNRTKIGGIHQHTGNSQDHSSHQQEGSLFMSERKDFCSIAIHNYVSALSSSPSPRLIYLGIHNLDIYADLCSLKLFSRSLIQYSRVPWGETFCSSLQWQRLIEAPASLRVAFLSKFSSETFKKKKHWTEKKGRLYGKQSMFQCKRKKNQLEVFVCCDTWNLRWCRRKSQVLLWEVVALVNHRKKEGWLP